MLRLAGFLIFIATAPAVCATTFENAGPNGGAGCPKAAEAALAERKLVSPRLGAEDSAVKSSAPGAEVENGDRKPRSAMRWQSFLPGMVR